MSVVFRNFEAYPGLRYGFSTKKDGSMHRHLRKENREAYLKSVGIDPRQTITPDLAHGAKAMKITRHEAGQMVPAVDGLSTEVKGLFLSVTGADCFPLYFYDPEREVIGMAHAGWRGILKGIVGNTVQLLGSEFQADPARILVGIGPGIRKCHFDLEDGKEMQKFEKEYPDMISAQKKGSRKNIDLPGIIKRQLQTLGISEGHIEDTGICTFCNSKEYFSYRRDRPAETEAMIAYMGMT